MFFFNLIKKTLKSFDWNNQSESMGSRRAAKHLHDELNKFMLMNDFICVDVNSLAVTSPFSFTFNGITYKGGTDCLILPKYAMEDQKVQSRVIIEFKLDKDNSGNKINLIRYKVRIAFK